MNPYYLKYYSNYRYFENIINTIQNIRLSKKQESYLLSFVFHPHYSAYDIERNNKAQYEREDITFDFAYRQAKNIVRKLYELKLIKLDKEKEKHSRKKKFYSLTDMGLFYIIRLPTFLSIDIQSMIRNYPDFKIFKDLLYSFIKSETLCSENIPIDILNAISLYIQHICSTIKNFILFAINKNNWGDEIEWNWNTEALRKYLIDKYKYNWLENAETKENYDQTILKFFNKNKCSQYIDIRLRLKGDKISGYLKGKRTKKQEIIIPNIETFLIKFNLSKEEKIGRSFSNYYTMGSSKFIFSLLSASTSCTFDISLLFSKDENFIQSLETAKEDFDNFYLSIKNPYQYSFDALIAKDLWELSYQRDKDNK